MSETVPLFPLGTDGTAFTNLHGFTVGDGGTNPFGGLILSSNTLYGTAYGGGDPYYGGVFKLSNNGTDYTVEQMLGFIDLHAWRLDKMLTALAKQQGIDATDNGLKRLE